MIDLLLLAVGVIGGGAIGYGIGQVVEARKSAEWERIARRNVFAAITSQRCAEDNLALYQDAAMKLDLANKRLDGDGPTQIYATPLPCTDLEFDEEEPAMVDPAG